ncbi:hypothetical protein SBOR_9325 [Sclerotinia borealis F-4128]|uniref:Centrosomin N-terminal motif 1 domain-containing protein n=1 Tax=Sclerotinia borealis (strain F-4128) TaxID=1432307 RepID=W9C369_SCLBF|nr:hypothetical protein SBOR_9325 [Sclerotinia borealis F-4128]
MEDESQGSRRSRISSTARMPLYHESATNSSSNNTRMNNMATPTISSQSTNSSSAHLPLGGGRSSAQSGRGTFLQERLRERKERDKRSSADFGASINMGRDIQSSPGYKGGSGSGSGVGVARERDDRRPSSSGVGQPGKMAMGVKQMEETVSTLHKQNFDLKLELFHRRQRQETLELELELANNQIQEQAEMQEINEALLKELEKRDQAVEEAVTLVCELEAKVERLLQEREDVRSFDSQYGNDYIDYDHGHGIHIPSSPPTIDKDTMSTPRGKERSKVIARMPSFLSEQSEGVEALRSLYLPSSSSYSDVALPKLPEEDSESGMASPSLSVLSESSFLSIYGEKSPATNEDFDSPPPRQHRRTSSSVEKWIDERPASTMPMPIPSPSSQYSGRRSQFLSMNYVAASPLQRLEKLRNNLEKQYNNSTNLRLQSQSKKRDDIQDRQRLREGDRRHMADANGFDTSQILPPTPDTISTGTLRNYKNSDDTLNQRHQANEDEVTFLNITSTFSAPPTTYNPCQSTISMRPRSAGETVTSRREGHGWDTDTLETDELDTFTISSTESTKIHPPTRQPRGGNQTPEFLSFNTTSRERDDSRIWGGDGVSNNCPTTRVPSGTNSNFRTSSTTAQRYEILRTAPQAETQPRSDDTITPGYSERRPQSQVEDHRERHTNREIERSSTPLDENTPRPSAPDRRSSLAAATSKLRKHAPAAITTSHDSNIKIPLAPVSASIPNTPSREFSKEKEGGKEKDFRRLLPSRLFFGRLETAPANIVNSPSSSSSNSNTDRRAKYQSLPTRNRYSNRRTDLSNYQLDGSDESGNGVGKKTYYEEDEAEDDRERSATPPPIARNRAQSAQDRREYGGRPRSVGARERERETKGFGGDGIRDRDEVVRDIIAGSGDERKCVKGSAMGMGRERSENMHVDASNEGNKENDAVKDKENSSSANTGHGRKWFGLAHVGVGRSASVSRR